MPFENKSVDFVLNTNNALNYEKPSYFITWLWRAECVFDVLYTNKRFQYFGVLSYLHIWYLQLEWVLVYFVRLSLFLKMFLQRFFLFFEIFISMINSQLFNLAIVCVPFLYHLQMKNISHTFSPNLFILPLIAYGQKINLF